MRHTQRGEKFLTAGSVARLLGVSRWTIMRWFRAGHMPCAMVAGRRMISVRSLDRWRDEHGDGDITVQTGA